MRDETTRDLLHLLRGFTALVAVWTVFTFDHGVRGTEPASDDPKERTDFAELTLGADLLYVPSLSRTYAPGPNGNLERRRRAHQLMPRLVVGGYHFWGHADFYVAFPLTAFQLGDHGDTIEEALLSPGIETGARIYPWALRTGHLRPFFGVAWSVGSYRQTSAAGEGPTVERHHVPLMAGLSYRDDFGVLELGLQWSPSLELDYPVTPTERRTVGGDFLAVWLGYEYAIDTTAGAAEEIESGEVRRRRRRQREAGARSDFEIAAGVSSAFTTPPSDFDDGGTRRLPDAPGGAIMPDVALGYYLHRAQTSVRLDYRPIVQTQEGYGASRRYVRHSLSFDVLKHLGDYYGFVPFAGAGVSIESLDFSDTGPGQPDLRERRWRGGASLIAGWDIRPTDTASFTLRTNLRYTPGLALETAPGDVARFSHFEFNFIQLVLHPRRLALELTSPPRPTSSL